MADLKKRKKSLNQIVNPAQHQVQTYFSHPANNTSSFKPCTTKSKAKKQTEHNVSSHYTYSNLMPIKPEAQQPYIKRSITQREIHAKDSSSIISQNKAYYFSIEPQNQAFCKADSQTPLTSQPNFKSKENSRNLDNMAPQHTTLKKSQKKSQNPNSFLEFSNNSAKTQIITGLGSNQKINVSDCMELNFSHTMIPEPMELICHEHIQFEREETQEKLNIYGSNFNENSMQVEENTSALLSHFQQESGFEFTYETLQHLIKKENEYSVPSNYFKTNQKNITPYMRAILLDWMMEVSNEFTLKRETFHLAVNYVDRVLSLSVNVPKNELQLIGVVSMFLASKIEEVYPPKLSDFALSADNAFTHEQIKEKEENILRLMKFKINPPTYYMWSNWLMTQWDLYLDHSTSPSSYQLKKKFPQIVSYFKQPKEESYALFREMMQLIDCSLLDTESLQYKPRALILAFLYLVLGKTYQQFDENQIILQMPLCNANFLNKEYIFNDFFANFSMCCMGIDLSELLPYIQYCAKFFGLGLNFDLPNAAKINKQYVLEGHFEEFLAYQTHNPNNLEFIKKKKQ